jgi:hypothetical protein
LSSKVCQNINLTNDAKTYEGMDSPKLGSFSDVHEPILSRGYKNAKLPL